MHGLKQSLLIILLVLVSYAAGSGILKPASCGAFCSPVVQTVPVAEFNKLAEDKTVTVIDVRTPREFNEGHIENAVNADISNISAFNEYISSLDKRGKYLIYCRSGKRSGQALKIMEQKGFTNVSELSGGILSWQQEGYSLVKN